MGSTALITGATAGFGEACARRFAGAGWKLVLTGRRVPRLEALREELGKATAVHVEAFDVRNRRETETRLATLPSEFRDVDLLVNNAGLALGLEPAQEADLDDWETMVDTNVRGLMVVTRMLLPGMVARGRGHVVNIGSTAASWPYPGGNVYGATKAFVAQFSRNLRADLLGTGVRVTDVQPGLAETEFSVVRFKGDAEKAAAVYRAMKPLAAGDIAEIVFWVATLPPHVNVNALEVMPVQQAWGPLAVHREPRTH
jgi:3-hydroxy acid dehydrogenase/malonic semialdehyde reductase